MNAWIPIRFVKSATTLGASETETPIGTEFTITANGAKNILVALRTSSTTVATGITAKLQTSVPGLGANTWTDAASVAITGDGEARVSLMESRAADQASLPLGQRARVVVTTGAGDAVTIDAAVHVQEQ